MLTSLSLGHGGRLANQMFILSGVIGLATKFGHEYAFPYWMNHEHKEAFGSSEDIDVQSWFKNKLPLLHNPLPNFTSTYIEFNSDPNETRIVPHLDQNITQQWSGHLQSEKWFAHCKDLIRHYFEFDPKQVFRGNVIVETFPWLWEWQNPCGVHVRIGDYAKSDSWQPVLTTDYYHRAMELFPFPTTFIVFSDEPDKAKQIIEPTGMKCIYISGNHYMIDLFLMTNCKNFIIGNSTFSWWGAWLINNPDKKIIAPSVWWKDVVLAQWGYSTKNLYPESWIVI